MSAPPPPDADPAPLPRAVSAAGRDFIVDAAREGRFWDAFAAGRWEPATLRLIAALTGPGTLFLDAGAWVGPTALTAAAGAARVIALEPDPVARRWLRRNLALNPALAARVTVLDRALAPTEGRLRLAAPRGKGGNSMTSALVEGAGTAWEVETITPAALAAMRAADERLVVKIDIEGGEYAALPAFGPLAAHADAVLLAWHPALALGRRRGLARVVRGLRLAVDTRDALRPLAGFEAFALGESRPRPRPAPLRLAALGAPVPPLRGEWLFLRPGVSAGLA